MRLLPVPKYRDNCKFYRSKGIVLMTLANNPGWYRPVVISNATGLSLGSLLVLMAKWSGHGYLGKNWRLLERRLRAGYFEYRLSDYGKWYFCEYHEIMPLRHWHQEILEWQAMNNPKNRNNRGNGQTQ